MLVMPSSFEPLIQLTASASPYFWLFEGTSPTDSGLVDVDGAQRVLRATSSAVAVRFDANPSNGEPLTWKPWPYEMSAIPSRSDGSNDGVSLALGNVDGYMTQVHDANNRLDDCIVRLHLVHADLLDDPSNRLTFKLRVSETQLGFAALTLRLGSLNFGRANLPPDIITRSCRKVYRSPQCGFVGDPKNKLGQCSHLMAACIARGVAEDEEGLPVIHPLFFGGFEGLPAGTFLVS